MEKFKIKIYFDEYGKDLEFESLSKSNSSSVLEQLSSSLKAPSIKESKDFFPIVKSKLEFYKSYDDTQKLEFFKGLLDDFQIAINEDDVCFLIWNVNDIDSVTKNFLVQNWDYFWYGPSDEAILLFFNTVDLIILITDYGEIRSNRKFKK